LKLSSSCRHSNWRGSPLSGQFSPSLNWRAIRLKLPLEQKPIIKQVGLNVHGQRRVERYVMDRTWSLHVYRWQGSLAFRGTVFPVKPGHVSIEPPDTPLVWRYDQEVCPHYYVHFALPPGRARTAVPVMQDLGDSFDELCSELELLIGLFSSHRARAEVRLWDLLLRLSSHDAGTVATSASGLPYAVQTAVAIIENEIGTNLRAAALSRRVAVSHNHLTRMFQRAFGCGIAEYVRRRRAAKALPLLERSNLPIKSIASEIGLPDLQQFNKFARRMWGTAPSAVRRRSRPK
jgi:AraC-like DNA-binding protein